jgi:hypothetical protein
MEQIGSPALRIIERLAQMIEREQAKANAIANKIGTDEHTRFLGVAYENHAEAAQRIAKHQAAVERLHKIGFVR